MIRDPVCGAEISAQKVEVNQFYQDYAGQRNMFCSEACSRLFRKYPEHYSIRTESDTPIGHCELCSKRIYQGDQCTQVSYKGKTFEFCCEICAAAFSKAQAANDAAAEDHLNKNIERLRGSALLPWLREANRLNASDLFLSVGESPILKIYGEFQKLSELPLTEADLLQIIQSILPEKKLADFLSGRDVDAGLDVEECSRFRVNVFRHLNGNSIALRPLPYKIPTIEELRLPPVFSHLSNLTSGLILITGPTGSGKTTSLAALVDMINCRDEKHIITIEDPIEYKIPNQRSLVHQREVGSHTRSFADGLRSALRENPDIIVVGELRDLESISLAIRAAETGQLVLGTLHCGTAMQAITRIVDVFEGERQSQIRIQLSQSLQAVCAQRLYRNGNGQGMVVATEVLIATLALRTLIRENRIQEIRGYMETGQREQMHSFKQSIQGLFDKGLLAKDTLLDSETNPVPELSEAQLHSN
ncbi:MAG: PilT/PilU family type 4a pilus ATPase [Candidatus Omnitrophica bacterium]|nr:PilT/PilU family type 4a pilus ATPase [Candidatus Omnitrophota bacterium]